VIPQQAHDLETTLNLGLDVDSKSIQHSFNIVFLLERTWWEHGRRSKNINLPGILQEHKTSLVMKNADFDHVLIAFSENFRMQP
jgi:hypothetical protein